MTSTRLIEKEEEVGKGFFERNKGREEKRGGGGGGEHITVAAVLCTVSSGIMMTPSRIIRCTSLRTNGRWCEGDLFSLLKVQAFCWMGI